jgi:membrane protease YdiL (CAAX protease family)
MGVIISVWIAARYFDKRPFTEYGININKLWLKEYLIGVFIAVVAQGTIFLIEWSAGWITITNFGWNVDTETPFGLGITIFFLTMLMVGFHEELFSRGYQTLNLTEGLRYPKIGARGAVIIAVLLTSSLFGLMHLGNPNASAISTFNIIIAGIVLATPFILTGRLALSAGLHFSWNFVMTGILGFPVSGMEVETTVLHIQQGGTKLWTGGAFGPEAGLVGLIGMAIIVGGSCVYVKVAEYELAIAELFKKKYEPAIKSDEQSP